MEIKPVHTSHLARLQKLLEYELSSSMLLLLQFFMGGIVVALTIAAVLFTPFMIMVLYREGRKGWILFFGLFVAVPVIAIFFIDIRLQYKQMLGLLALLLFYLYCYMLRLAIREWDD